MGESLIAIFCVSDISAPIISSILTKAYQYAINLDSPPSLLLLDNNRNTLHQYTRNSVTYPPVESPLKSPFLGWSIRDAGQLLNENADGSIVDSRVFLVADEETAKDEDTLLMVQNVGQREDDKLALKCVRLAAEHVNTEAVTVSVATKDIEEILSLVNGNVVYGGGMGGRDSHQPPKKGGKAPKKQL